MLGVRASPVDSGSLVRSCVPWLVQGPSAGPCCRAPSPGPAPLCRRRRWPTAAARVEAGRAHGFVPDGALSSSPPAPVLQRGSGGLGGPQGRQLVGGCRTLSSSDPPGGELGAGPGQRSDPGSAAEQVARLSQTRLSTLASGPRTEAARWEGASAEGVRFVPVEVGVGGSRLPHGVSAATRQASVSCKGREPSNRSALCIDLKFHRPFLDKAVGVTRH